MRLQILTSIFFHFSKMEKKKSYASYAKVSHKLPLDGAIIAVVHHQMAPPGDPGKRAEDGQSFEFIAA